LTTLFETTKAQVSTEGRKTYLEGMFLISNKINKNNRRYTEACLDQAVAEIAPRIREKSFVGTLSHDSGSTIDATRISVSGHLAP
jgi:hypothetical protein